MNFGQFADQPILKNVSRRDVLKGIVSGGGLVLAGQFLPRDAMADGGHVNQYETGAGGMPGGVVWDPHVFVSVAPDGTDTKILHTDTFKRGKGKFAFKEFVESKEIVEHGKDFPYILTTNRVLEHYNAGTMTRRTPNAQIVTEDVLMIHPDDAAKHGIADGDWVCIESARGKVDSKAFLTDEVKPGVVSTTFHFPELMVNVVTSSVTDSEALCPEYKVVSVRIRKARRVAERHLVGG